MRILWHGPAPWAPTGYGVQAKLWVKRLIAAGHDVACSAPFSFAGAPLMWDGILVLPQAQEQYGNDIIAGHFAFHNADVMITLCDVYMINPAILRELNVWSWCPVDSAPVSVMDRIRLTEGGIRPIAMSRFGQDELRKAGIEAPYVPHGVDPEVFKPLDRDMIRKQLGIGEGTFVIGINAANNDAVRKAFPEQFAAFARFRERHPDSLLLVHSQAVFTEGGTDLQAIARNLGIEDAVKFSDRYTYVTGMIDATAMAAWYNVQDLFSGATYGEGFGVPVIEAQACGTPVVVTNGHTGPELRGPGSWAVDGEPFWVPSHQAWWVKPSITAIAEAYEEAWQNREAGDAPDLRQATATWGESFSADRIMTDYWEPVLAEIERSLPEQSPDASTVVQADGLNWQVSSRYVTADRLGPEHEQGVTEYVLGLLPEDGQGVFLDVGAHVGHYSLRAARLCKRVIAIEANQATAERLVENLALNEITNVDVLNVAAWDRSERLRLDAPSGRARDGSTRVLPADGGEVEGVRLSTVLESEDRIDLVKLDVEGADLHALRGMEALLRRLKPVLFVEDHSIYGYYKFTELISLLEELGYTTENGPTYVGCTYVVARPREEN